MPKILVITNKQSVLDVIEQLHTLKDDRIEVVTDFTQGLKAIFYNLPTVVFIQGEIGGITGEKVASQVKTLLEGEPIKLVLLRDETDTWDAENSNFDDSIDICLPLDAVVHQFQQQLPDSTEIIPATSAVEGQYRQDDMEMVELTDNSPQSADEFNNDPFADIFPAHIHDNWGTLFPAVEQDLQIDQGQVELSVEPLKPADEFSFDAPFDIKSAEPFEQTFPMDVSGNDFLNDLPIVSTPYGQLPLEEENLPHVDILPDNNESLAPGFIGKNGEKLDEMQFQRSENGGSSASIENRLRLKGLPTHSSILKTSSAESTVQPTASFGMTGEAVPRQSGSQPASIQPSGKNPSNSVGTHSDKLSNIYAGPHLYDEIPFQEEYGEKTSLLRKCLVGSSILVLCLATYLLVQHWEDLSGIFLHEKVPVASPSAANYHNVQELPAFIPRGNPDGAYAASHPGWERFEGNGLEFLVFRENKHIKAIQVIAAQGEISDSYFKMCLRQTTGRENFDSRSREKRGDFLVEKGTLLKKGELVVYRKMPEGEIRGFVLTFY
jgi:hypothetical protein